MASSHTHRESPNDQALPGFWQLRAKSSDIIIRATDHNTADVLLGEKFSCVICCFTNIPAGDFIDIISQPSCTAASSLGLRAAAAFGAPHTFSQNTFLLDQLSKVKIKKPGTLFIHQSDTVSAVSIQNIHQWFNMRTISNPHPAA